MLYQILGTFVPLAAIALFSVWGLLIGIKRVRVRFFSVAISFLVALIAAFAVKNLQTAELMSILTPYFEKSGNEALMFLAESESLYEVVAVCGGAMLAPWVFLTVFTLVNSVAWIVSGIAFLISSAFRSKDGEDDYDYYALEEEKPVSLFSRFFEDEDTAEDDGEALFPKKKTRFLRILIYATAQVFLTAFVILTPVVSTINYLPGIVTEADQAGVFRKMGETKETTVDAELLLGELDKIKSTPVVTIYRKLGGEALCKSFASFTVSDRPSDLYTELTVISEFGFDMFRLYELQIQDYTEEEIILLREIDRDMQTSVFLPVVSGEFIYAVTDAWLDESGPRKFMGMNKPTFDKDTTSMAATPFEHILEAFHKDARDIDALRDDFETIEHVMEILINEGVVESMNASNTNPLVEILSSGTTVEQLLAEFDKNPSFQPLRRDIITIGMRSVGSSLKISGNSDEIYSQFNDDMAAKLNGFTSDSSLSHEEKKEKMTAAIRDSYQEKAGKELELNDAAVGAYADVLLEEFDGRDDVTPEEMAQFFEGYTGIERNSDQS